VEIDALNSAEVWSSFRVGRRPAVGPVQSATDQSGDWIEASHEGFGHLHGSPIHCRRVTITTQGVRVLDRIEGCGIHTAKGFVPIHPGVALENLGDNLFRLRLPSLRTVEIAMDGPIETTVQTGRFALGFGVTVERPSIQWRWRGVLPVSVETRLSSGKGR
jgi:hypothetical protein